METHKKVLIYLCLFAFLVFTQQAGLATTAIEKRSIFLENEFIKLRIDSPSLGGVVSSLIYKPSWLEFTGEAGDKGGGLFRDRVTPISNLWRELTYEAEIIAQNEDMVTALVKSIPSEESKGVEVKKYYILRKGQSSIETNWEITNNGSESINIAPWVWCNVIPDRAANYYMPTEKKGLYKISGGPSYVPSRNWVGAIDKENHVSISFVMDYNKVVMEYAWLGGRYRTQEWLYNSVDLAPGDSWSTTYYTNMLPLEGEYSLAYASPEVSVGIKKWQLAAGIENKLEMELSFVGSLDEVEIKIEIMGPDLFVVPETFNLKLSNQEPAKVYWNWKPPVEGTYLLKAKLYKAGKQLPLGQIIQNPSPDVEIPLVVGKYEDDTLLFPAWPKNDDEDKIAEQRTISGSILSKKSDIAIWSVPSLEKIFLNDIVDLEKSAYKDSLTVDLAKREREAIQVVLSPSVGKDFKDCYLTFGEFRNSKNSKLLSAESLKYNPVGYVFTKMGSRFSTDIRTGYWPDPLLETKYFDAIGGQNTPIWITVYANPKVEPGLYEGNLIIRTDKEIIVTLPMSINVWPFELPKTPKLKTALDFKGVPADQIDSYIDNFLEHRISPRRALGYPSAITLKSDPDFSLFDSKMENLLQKGLNNFMVGDLKRDPQLARKFIEHLKEKGWLDMAYVYLTDEPGPSQYPRVKKMAEEWKNIVPELKLMVTVTPIQDLVGSVDIWCSGVVDDSQLAKQVLAREEELWWYHTDPLHPEANFLIDMPAVDARSTFWKSWQGFLTKGYTGFLYSWSTWPDPSPWEETGPFLSRNGVESQIYPSDDGPVNSIRWEAIRDGIEDYDYCYLLWYLLQRVDKDERARGYEKEIENAKKLLEFPDPLPEYVGKENIIEKTEMWRKEVAENIVFFQALLNKKIHKGVPSK